MSFATAGRCRSCGCHPFHGNAAKVIDIWPRGIPGLVARTRAGWMRVRWNRVKTEAWRLAANACLLPIAVALPLLLLPAIIDSF